MNPDEFIRLHFRSPLAEEMALHVMSGGSITISNEVVYKLLVEIFTEHIELFRVSRRLANLSSGKQLARLPGGHALVLWPPGETLLRGKHAPDPPLDLDAPDPDDPDPDDPPAKKASRIVVAGCGPRFHRALQVIQHAERKMFLHRQNNVLAGFPEPVRLASGGPYR